MTGVARWCMTRRMQAAPQYNMLIQMRGRVWDDDMQTFWRAAQSSLLEPPSLINSSCHCYLVSMYLCATAVLQNRSTQRTTEVQHTDQQSYNTENTHRSVSSHHAPPCFNQSVLLALMQHMPCFRHGNSFQAKYKLMSASYFPVTVCAILGKTCILILPTLMFYINCYLPVWVLLDQKWHITLRMGPEGDFPQIVLKEASFTRWSLCSQRHRCILHFLNLIICNFL